MLCIILLQSTHLVAQSVGINTTTPNGVLDVNSSSYGIVLPRIALTATNVAAPVQNPQGGNPLPGTVIYNTSSTSTGTNDVYPGIYVWTGSEWFNKFTKKHSQLFLQSAFFQPASNKGYENIPGIDSKTFVAQYTGTYKIEVSMNYGGGYINNASAGADVGAMEGNFRFNFNGTNYIYPAKTSCTLTASGTRYYAIWEQFSVIQYIDLVAGTTYNFDLDFDQAAAPGFVNSGNSGTGRGYIGIPDHVPCTVEFTYIGD
jgi:hypothetical protein